MDTSDSTSPPLPGKGHSDIRADRFLIRLCPAALRPYALLARLDRPAGTWLLLLPGWWAILMAAGGVSGLGFETLRLMGLFAVGALVMRSAGCVINDLLDRDLDRQVERTRGRPLAAGLVSPKQAMAFLAGLLGLGLVVLLQMNGLTIALGVLTLPLVGLYPLMKRITWWPQAWLGMTFNFGALMGWTAVSGALALPPLLLWAAGICWTLGYDTIYAHQDREDDLRVGIRSTALLFGERARVWIAGFYAAAFGLILAAGLIAGGGFGFVGVMLLPGLHLIWQMQRWDPADPASSLAVFRSSRDFGFLIALALLFS